MFSCFGKENKSDSTREHAYLSEKTISSIKREKPNKMVFLLMHFPIDYFSANDARFFKEKISKNVDVILNGHLHTPEKEILIGKENVSLIQGDYFSEGGLNESGSFIKIDLSQNKYYEFKWEDDSYVEQDKVIDLNISASKWNANNISFNKDYQMQLVNCDILDKKFNIEDIFVFPYMWKEKYGDSKEKDTIIKEFSSLLNKTKSNPYIFIYGDEGSGKTSLSKYLTLLFFNENYFPVLCDGDQFKENVDIEKIVKKQIKEMYSSSDVSKFYNEASTSRKILIIDNYSQYDDEVLIKANEIFKSIIIIARTDKKELINKPCLIEDSETLEFTIQPMVKSKRKEFTYKLYTALTSLGEQSNLTKEQFFVFIEKQLSALNINDICDPISLAYIEINAFHSSDSFDNSLFSNVNQAKSLILLDNKNKSNNYNYNTDVVNRIISYIAYSMYKDSKQEFFLKDVDSAIEQEKNTYGDPGIKNKDFVKLMQDSLIFKGLIDKDGYTFFNRDIFSYFIAYFIHLQLEDDSSYFTDLLNKDIFVPLNFNILMCLTSIYKSKIIPNKIIDLIYEQVDGIPLLDESNFSVAGITKEKQEELKRLTQEDVDKINDIQDEHEKEKHNNYLKNKDNLYYVDIVPKQVKEINTWLDKLKICCILLKNFSSLIKIDRKQKLIKLVISLPNLILYQFNDYLFKELDNLYAELKGRFENTSNASVISKFNNFIISTKRAFILSTYDYGSRCFNDNACKELLKESCKVTDSPDSELNIVQRLMFESFIIHGESFIKSCSAIIKDTKYKDNSFLKISAKLIGRRYVIENYETCNKKYKSFMGLIFKDQKEVIQLMLNEKNSK